jgi:hypothetical protein
VENQPHTPGMVHLGLLLRFRAKSPIHFPRNTARLKVLRLRPHA